jgi:ABC-type oligopeptide transport system ATPase subunit
MIIKAENLTVNFKNNKDNFAALKNVDFFMQKGKITALAGLIKPDTGKVTLDGLDVFERRNEVILRRSVQMVFQNPYLSFDPRYTVFDTLYESLSVFHKIGFERAQSIVASLLFYCGIRPELMLRYPHQLSGGQLQRAAIARSIINKPRTIIFDEPTSSLDVTTSARILGFLRDLQERHGLTFLFISHNLRMLRKISHNIFVMYRGKIVEQGLCEEVCAKPGHPYTRLLLDAAYQRAVLDKDDLTLAACVFYGRCPKRTDKCLETVSVCDKGNGHIIFCNNSNDY